MAAAELIYHWCRRCHSAKPQIHKRLKIHRNLVKQLACNLQVSAQICYGAKTKQNVLSWSSSEKQA